MGPMVRAGRGLAVLALLFNAATWGVSWWPFRSLMQLGLHPLWATTLVFAAAVLVFSFWQPSAWRHLLASPSLWVIALASGATNAAFNWGVTIGEVARVVLLFYLMPLWAMLLAWWLLGERPHAGIGLRLLLSVGGAAVVLLGDGDGPARGLSLADGLGVLGGMTFALNNVMLRRATDRPESSRALAMFVGGCVTCLGVAASGSSGALGLAEPMHWPPEPALGWLLPVAGLSLLFMLSNLALQYGASRLSANVTAVVMPTEVLFASCSALWIAGEPWSPALMLGGAMILAATLLAAWQDRA
ncbi:EamA domain-containing membrane protein RarD [Sphaerotilus hippei]|uniref:EamA domain-containing membrane protein RarD n=2 Tax=Sphaerotilus hippei TaxID=744406 RepID=A0A318HC29_9BURK|nr:EamA domain-containing membrane protein RarD [Sphaerotilus hippei]